MKHNFFAPEYRNSKHADIILVKANFCDTECCAYHMLRQTAKGREIAVQKGDTYLFVRLGELKAGMEILEGTIEEFATMLEA